MDEEETVEGNEGEDEAGCCGGGDCGAQGGGCCEPSMADKAEMMAHWAKKQLLHEKIRERIGKAYGKQLDALADAIADFAKESHASEAEHEKKAGALEDKMEEVFG
ncbi:MAG: hypothetical protein V1787_02160 [Candidatus Micrarchaeota archaeon]